MKLRLAGLGLVIGFLSLAADTRLAVGSDSNKNFDLQATLYNTQDDINKLIGEELGKGIIVIEVTITPREGKLIEVWREDFSLRSDKDGQRSEPYDPSQIAGSSVLELATTSHGTRVSRERTGPIWGGVGGNPRRLPGKGEQVSLGSDNETMDVQARSGGSEPENELLAVLERKVLKEVETSEPVSGLLYFPLDGKHKIKQLELHYRGDAGALNLRFKREKR